MWYDDGTTAALACSLGFNAFQISSSSVQYCYDTLFYWVPSQCLEALIQAPSANRDQSRVLLL